ncbi:hemagglutinin repeat-containing protein [Nissabacter sp. SGAir0207]|uniref:two-partner secretion domain-containing protein n=1 Tax=Nissabacter sp. SGAir0207 TaxID=2126321 RepID=UPI00143CC7BF|nr:hemagglutinin repeat-containing protein [Nissabacter sp. SGAir0207]
MNKHCYRIIFNRQRGMLMVVPEIAHSGQGKSGRPRGARPSAHPLLAVLRPLRLALWGALGMALLSPAQAALVADGSAPGNQRPTIINSANGTPQVNIQTPSAAGVSRNRFSEFNVDGKGAILNNSHAATQTQLGGLVTGNPWLARGEAKVILNEVNARDPSQLNGYIEVAGRQAQVVIANPAGITCEGCGFINANRATLTTGQPQWQEGALSGYQVNGGEIAIQGRGLDSSGQSYTDLIARSVKVNAGVWAQDLRVTAGANQVDAAHERVTAQSGSAPGRPTVAIDVAQLGGMYANKIRLIGTEQGVGVRNAGLIGAAAGEVHISADGRIENSGSLSGQGINLTAQETLNSGTLYSEQALAVRSQQITNQGTLAAAGNAMLQGGTLVNQAGGVMAAGMAAEGTLTSAGNLTLTAEGQLTSHGSVLAGGALTLTGDALDLSQGQGYGQSVDLTARQGEIVTRDANIEAAGTLRATTRQTLRNDGGTLQADTLQLTADRLSNQHGSVRQFGDGDLRLAHQDGIDNRGGTLASNGQNLLLSTETFDNTGGSLLHAGSGLLTVTTGTLTGAQGEIITNGELRLSGNRLGLDGATTGARRIDLSANTFSHQGGLMQAEEAFSLAVRDQLDNHGGTLATAGALTVVSGALDNQNGVMQGGQVAITSAAALNNQQGQIAAEGALTLDAQGLDNHAGMITADRATLALHQQALDNRAGTLAASGDLTLDSGRLDNSAGLIQAGRDLTLNTHGQQVINRDNGTQGGLIAQGTLRLEGGDLDNTGGLIGAQQISLSGGHLTNAQGQLGAASELSLMVGDLDNYGGTVSAGERLTLSAHTVDNRAGTLLGKDTTLTTADVDNRGGVVAALAALTLNSAALNNADGGLIQSGGALHLDTHGHALNNARSGTQGGIISQGDLTVHSGTLDNQQGAIIANGQLALTTLGLLNDNGLVAGLSGLEATTGAVSNHAGAIQSGGALYWQAAGQRIDNQEGLISAANALSIIALELVNLSGEVLSGGALAVEAAALTNRDGLIASQGNGTLHSEVLDNHAGAVQSVGDLVLEVQGDFTNEGTLQANGDLALSSGGTVTNTALIAAGQQLALSATALDNQQGGEISGGQIDLRAGQSITNRGLIDGLWTRLSSQTLTNIGSGRIYGDHLSLQAEVLNNLAEGGSAATLAARERLDLGVDTLNNREHGLIYSGGDLAIGGTLDEHGLATGSARRVNNVSATIESASNLWLDVATLNNLNDHFATEVVQVSQDHIEEYFVVDYEDLIYGPDEVRIKNKEVDFLITKDFPTTATDKNDHWVHRDYILTVDETRITESDPAVIRAGGDLSIHGQQVLNDKSQIIAGGTLSIDAGTLDNVEVAGERITTRDGWAETFWRIRDRGGDNQGHSKKALPDAPVIEAITLRPGSIEEHASAGGERPAIDRLTPGSVANPALGPLDGAGWQSLDGGVRVPPGKTFEVPAAPQNGSASVVRITGPETRLPDSSLFHILPASDADYLVETDPRFTNQQAWLSSDYMLAAFQSDPDRTLKRLGDGYYEQKLVRDQVAALTGQRYLSGYTSDEEQYRALMNAGIAFGQQYQLTPGVALTAEQMGQLTQDIVWMVAQPVTLADGSVQQVLVPQVYAHVQPGDVQGSGALLAGRDVNINLSGDFNNSGRVLASQSATLVADNITNRGGTLYADTLALQARTDINHLGGLIGGEQGLTVVAGRDIHAMTGTRSAASAGGDFATTTLDRLAAFQVTEGDMLLQAGRDLTLTAAQITNQGAQGQTQLQAGRDLRLDTVTTAAHEQLNFSADQRHGQSSSQQVGSTLAVAGDLALIAGRDMALQAASATAGGTLALAAGNDLSITHGERQSHVESYSKVTGSNGIASRTTQETHATRDTLTAQGSLISGDRVLMQAGHDLTLQASNVVADRDLVLLAGNALSLTTATEHDLQTREQREEKSGLMGSGGIGFTLGRQSSVLDTLSDSQYETGSTLGSLNGNVTLNAGGALTARAADLMAAGDLTLAGDSVTLEAGVTRQHSEQHYEMSQSGLSVALSGSVGSAINSGFQTAQAADDNGNSRLAALQAMKAGLTGYQAYQATQLAGNNSGENSFVGMAVSLGSQQSESHQTYDQRITQGSALTAGGDLHILARDGDIVAQGAAMQAGHDLTLQASDNISLLAAQNSQTMRGESSSHGGRIGASIGLSGNGGGVSLFADASASQGQQAGNGTTWTESTAQAGNRLAFIAGQDVTLAGAQASGTRILADIGGDLSLISLQDSDRYQSDQRSLAAGLSAGSTGGGGYISAGRQQMDSDYLSVAEQSGLFAGTGGFDLRVGGHTQLEGAVIDSRALPALNQLETGSLGWRDLTNRAEFEAQSQGAGFSSSGSIGQQFTGNMANTLLNGGSQSGEAQSSSRAAIADGTLTVHDGSGLDISRDTAHSHERLSPIFDAEQEQARMEARQLIAELGTQVSDILRTEGKLAAQTAVNDPTRRAEAEAALRAEGIIPTGEAISQRAYELAQREYGTGSRAQQLTQAITAAMQGALSGDIGSALGGAAAPYVAEYVKTHTDAGAERIISHAVAGAVLAELQQGNALAGATGAGLAAGGAEYLANQLYPGKSPSSLSEAEKQTVAALTTLAASIAGGLTGGDLAAAVDGGRAGRNEVENNALGKAITTGCSLIPSCKSKLAGQLLEIGVKAGLTGVVVNEIAGNISSEDLDHLITLQMMGNDELTSKYLSSLQDKYAPSHTGGNQLPETLPSHTGNNTGSMDAGPSHTGNDNNHIDSDPNNTGNIDGLPDAGVNTTVTPIPDGPNKDDIAYLTLKGKEAQDAASNLGFDRRIPPQKAPFNSHGQPVFYDGKNYITPDIDSHNVTNGWKMFNSKGKRIGTYDSELNKIKD